MSLVTYVRVCAKQDSDWSAHAAVNLLDLVRQAVGFSLICIRLHTVVSFTGNIGESLPTD